ncbi:MAG: hypothetical protein KGL11_12025 [Alphaproteobacteria bacterium]|nr:hypothetical protein [Alphaproteobacteria bacterium]
MTFLRASDLGNWANREGADLALPSWVERAIKAGTTSVRKISFPKEKFIYLPGVDGRLVGAKAQSGFEQFIPSGNSIWELSVESGSTNKVSRDGLKRSKQRLSQKNNTFVFVTPRAITPASITKLKRKISRAGNWKDVRIIHGPLLHDWFNLIPPLALELACDLHGVQTAGAATLDDAWNELAGMTNPRLTEDLVIANRTDTAGRLLEGIKGEPNHTIVTGDSSFESAAFALAVLRSARGYEIRCVVFNGYSDAWEARRLPPCIFVVKEPNRAMTAALAAEHKHHIIVAAADGQATSSKLITLERPLRWDFAKALEKAKISEDEADRIARECGASITIMRRRMPAVASEMPWWANATDADVLRNLLLVGRWDAANKHDRISLQKLTGRTWDALEAVLRRFLNQTDAPLVIAGTVWAFKSQVDAFEVLAPSLPGAAFKELFQIVQDVFVPVPVPATTDASEERLFKPPEGHSDWIKDGLAQSLLLLAVRGNARGLSCPIPTGDQDGSWSSVPAEAFVNRLVTELTRLRDYRSLYESIRRQYRVLLEACPDPLLSALEHMLEGHEKEAQKILTTRRGILHDWPGAIELIWGLETLAWSPIYLPRVAKILARLSALELETKVSTRDRNQALEALTKILIWWLPQTFAPLQDRIQILDFVIADDPRVGWELLKALKPNATTTLTPTPKPKLRDFAPRTREVLTNRIAHDGAAAVIARLIACAAENPARWVEVIRSMSNFPPKQRELARGKFEHFAGHLTDPATRVVLWTTLRDEIARHRTFSNTQWALRESDLAPWQKILPTLAPSDPVATEKWLFDDWLPDLEDGISSVEERRDAVEQRRIEAIKRLASVEGLASVLHLAEQAQHPGFVGEAVVNSTLSAQDIGSLIDQAFLLNEKADPFIVTTCGLFCRRMIRNGQSLKEFVSDRVQSARATQIPEERIAKLFLMFPEERSTWDLVSGYGADIDREFWRRTHVPLSFSGESDMRYVVEKKLSVGRAVSLLDAFAFGRNQLPANDVLEVLDAAIEEIRGGTDPGHHVSHGLADFLARLVKRHEINDVDLAQRELLLLPLLSHMHGIRLRLYYVLARDPDWFVAFLCMLYRKASERAVKSELDEETRRKFNLAYLVFSSWKYVLSEESRQFGELQAGTARPFPGEQPDESINSQLLDAWVSGVRSKASSEDRAEVGDSQIGHIFAYAPTDKVDGAWPAREVRAAIEKYFSRAMAEGIQTEQFGKRGVVSKALYEGGKQEEALATEWRTWAQKVGPTSRHTQDILNKIADMWGYHARHEDDRAKAQRLEDE